MCNVKLCQNGCGRCLVFHQNEVEDSRAIKPRILSMLPRPTFHLYLVLGVSYLSLSSTSKAAQVLEIMLWCLDTLLKVSIDWKISTSIWFHCLKKNSVMKDKRNGKVQGEPLIRNAKDTSHL